MFDGANILIIYRNSLLWKLLEAKFVESLFTDKNYKSGYNV